jgi:hypothetical protein
MIDFHYERSSAERVGQILAMLIASAPAVVTEIAFRFFHPVSQAACVYTEQLKASQFNTQGGKSDKITTLGVL